MGANEDARTFEAANEAEALKAAAAIMESDRHENGNSFSGTIGMASGVKVLRLGKPVSQKVADVKLFGEWKRCKKTDPGAEENRTFRQETGKMEFAGYHRQVAGCAEKWEHAWLVQIKNPGSRKRLWLLGAMCSS